MKKVIIYSTPTCRYCVIAKDFFETNNISYTEYNVKNDLDKRKEMILKSEQMGVPVILVGDKVFIGFSSDTEKKIKKELEIK